MRLPSKALAVVHREESAQDFREIARRMNKLDPGVAVAMFSEYLNPALLPPAFLNLPMLVVYLVNPPPVEFKKARKLAVKEMGKVEEYQHFIAHDLPGLPITRFEWGMTLDPAVYGDRVVLKPENVTSTGSDINMVPTELVPQLKPEDFPERHLIHQDSYLVQKFVCTGDYPTHDRVLVLFDEVLYSKQFVVRRSYPDFNADIKTLLSTNVASNDWTNCVKELRIDDEMNALALRVASTFPENPMFGIDIVREKGTGKLYVLEVNLGGNTWHFSSKMVQDLVKQGYSGIGAKERLAMLQQYNAWDRAAEALLRKAHALAA